MSTAIRIRGLSKYFTPPVEIDGAEHPREAWQALLRIAGLSVSIEGRDDVRATTAAPAQVLRDISLEIDAGSVVCLAGMSGSGKSVLLRILAGVTPPTSGSVEIFGPVTSLLTVGDNLDERLTAEENLRLAAQDRNLSSDETSRYIHEAIVFAGLEGFEHAPLRTFSTGMLLRLSAALALCGAPAIVLVDDVLNVGDLAFQQTVVERVRVLSENGCTMVLALSDDDLVRQIATRVVTLAGGTIVGDAPALLGATSEYGSRAADVEWRVLPELTEDDVIALRSIDVTEGRDGDATYVTLSLRLAAKRGRLRCRPSIFLVREKTVLYRSLYTEFAEILQPSSFVTTVTIPTHVLPNGSYGITISIATLADGVTYSIKVDQAVTLLIRRDVEQPHEGMRDPLLRVTFPWEIERVAVGAA